jgi:glycosyltransferase involved in cell wall biosynthesis
MIRYTAESIKYQSHKDWEWIFVDDSSDYPGKPIVEDILGSETEKVKFYHTHDTFEGKQKRFSTHGHYWNRAVLESDSDICIILCDDDALYPGYLEGLCKWYERSPQKNYSYGHSVIFDPFEVRSLNDIKFNNNYHLNRIDDLNPHLQLDASQVSWRTNVFHRKDVDIRFPSFQTFCLDAEIFKQLYSLFGNCSFNNLITQYKAIHKDQLGTRNEYHKTIDITKPLQSLKQ